MSQDITKEIPSGSWDSHMHVVDPGLYPLSSSAQYTPSPHTISQAMTFESSVGISNIVLVQPSIYGNDNSCMLDALKNLGPDRARAVVTFDPEEIDEKTLQEWHTIGVRGVRLNFVSVGKKVEKEELFTAMRAYAKLIRPFDWVLQLYIHMADIPILAEIVPDLGVKVCIDHFGQPTLPAPGSDDPFAISGDPYQLKGFSSLIGLLKQGNTYVKLSAPYRLSKQPAQADLEPLGRELVKVAGMTRLVFSTDWPHTRFEGLDIRPYMAKAIEWCDGDKTLVERLFRSNAEDLWGVKR
ncbi:hypothetical protein BP5796_00934 [Coleophoma crateriformis]|uniref:Amidohydrolase-related domain-containing protein n=1 Tax=Coleophoma crateriformis TaxID=565419 RepID=A0A3D8T9R5_9HELO|nr:hypothetical protein BP5796_00934 [Coleophoma crateriformis]